MERIHRSEDAQAIKRISLNLMFAVLFITTPLSVQASGPGPSESGFSGRLLGGAFFMQTDSQFSTQSSNSVTTTLDGPANDHDLSSALASIYLRYQFENGSAVYIGNPLEGSDGFEVVSGVSIPTGSGTWDMALTWSPLSDAWKNPYQTGLARDKTDVEDYGLRVQWQDIVGSPWGAEYTVSRINIEDDIIGKLYDDLKRDGLEHELKVNYTLALRPGLTLNPEIGYTYADIDGHSNRYDGISMGTKVMAIRFPWMFIGLTSVRQNQYHKRHPLYNKTLKDSGFTVFGQVMRLNLFGVKRLFASGGAGYIYTDANINFFDSQTFIGLASVGINF